MKKALRRTLNRWRAAGGRVFGERTSTRKGLQAPMRLQTAIVPPPIPPRR